VVVPAAHISGFYFKFSDAQLLERGAAKLPDILARRRKVNRAQLRGMQDFIPCELRLASPQYFGSFCGSNHGDDGLNPIFGFNPNFMKGSELGRGVPSKRGWRYIADLAAR
jgi:hypothetical protein